MTDDDDETEEKRAETGETWEWQPKPMHGSVNKYAEPVRITRSGHDQEGRSLYTIEAGSMTMAELGGLALWLVHDFKREAGST